MKTRRIFGVGSVKPMPEGGNTAEEEEDGFVNTAEEEEDGFDKQTACLVLRRELHSDYSINISCPKRIKIPENGNESDESGSNPSDGLSGERPQDADYSQNSSLS